MIPNKLPPSDDNALLAKLSAYLAEAGPWSRRFNRLACDLAIGKQAHDELSCETCQELLDIYIEDEQAGKNVRQTYPMVWQHLMTCSDCQLTYDLVFEMLNAEEIPEPEKEKKQPLIPELPSIRPPAPPKSERGWMTRLQQAYDRFHVQFTFNLSYLHSLYAPPLLVRQVRSVANRLTTPQILLYEEVSVAGQLLTVEVIATRQTPDRLALQALVYSNRLPANLRALLTWGNETHSVPVGLQGSVNLGQVPLASLHNEEALFAFELIGAKKEE